ncbi:MAG: prephenate/arogenate dehydrogenase family protein [Pseudomonadota bacterium]
MSQIFDRVALIGLGLIAGSMSRAIRGAGLAGEVVGSDISPEVRAEAAEIDLVDRVCDTAAEAVEGADLVVLAVPVGAMGQVAQEIGPHLSPGATLSDVGSVKRDVIAAVTPHLPEGVHFVPAHPLAGTEHSGPRAGFAELFVNRYTLLVPVEGSDRAAVDRLGDLWRGMGANIDEIEPERHDLVLAVTSHAPHLIAYTMVGVADDLSRVTNSEVIKYSASGFRDFTRIAASDPVMWRDVFLSNKEATLEILGRFTEELFALQHAIRGGDGPKLESYFTRTRAIRRGIIEAGQDTHEPNFGRSAVASVGAEDEAAE